MSIPAALVGGNKVVVSVPVRFYRRNGRQMILADSIESESDLDESSSSHSRLSMAARLMTQVRI